MMKHATRWYSTRVGQDVSVVRWGHYGRPVLLFPTAGGDAEEVERFHLVGSLAPLIDAGRIKVYSCDSVAGQALVSGEGSSRYRGRMQNRFHEFVRHELVPAIAVDCRQEQDKVEVVATGASIGAFHALAMVCRFPEVFTHALCMSGTYDLSRFLKGDGGDDFHFASPVHFLPGLSDEQVAPIRKRFVLFASGQGRAEDIGESWRAAHILGSRGIPNRVDPWGPEWHHDWPTWRMMLPQYLNELVGN
jgi:esterase/lipase superfamily enzyme